MRVLAIDIDSPAQHAAMVEKLHLGFPFLSDPDRDLAITPFGVADPKDRRMLAIPTAILLAPGGEEAHRRSSSDFADRPTEEKLIEEAQRLGLSPVTQDAPRAGTPEPGRGAAVVGDLGSYFRGAKFAARAMSMRFPEAKASSIAYGAQMDRYIEALAGLDE